MVTSREKSPQKKRRRGKPVANVKHGSTVVPVYRSDTGGRTRFTIAFYREGRRHRQSFKDLESAKKEALLVAQQIQSGKQHLTDLRSEDREAYLTALELLEELDTPLVAAVREYAHARRLLGDVPLGTAAADFARRTRGVKVVEELLEAKRQDEDNDLDMPIMDVQRDQLDDWLRSRNVAALSRNSLLATIRVLFLLRQIAELPPGQ